MSLISTLAVAHSGLRAADAGIRGTSHNVANASTVGFHRRSVEQSVADPIQQRGLWLGQGVHVNRLGRSEDVLLARRVLGNAADASASATYSTTLTGVEAYFEDGAPTNLRQALDRFFISLTDASRDPADLSIRRQVARAGQGVSEAVSMTAVGLDESMTQVGSQVDAALPDVNDALARVAALNDALLAGGGALGAGDLADQRDQLLKGLASLTGARANFESDGQVTVFIGGHAVVSGSHARTLSFEGSGSSGQLMVSADKGKLDVTDAVGGELGGLLDARSSLEGYLNELNTFAKDFSQAVNSQHQAGWDATGAPGGALYAVSVGSEAMTMTFDDSLITDPALFAFAGANTALAGDDGNLRSLLGLQSQSIVAGTDPLQWATSLSAKLGGDVAKASFSAEHSANLLADTEELQASLFGVDLDEEATNLMMYQAAYQASAKVIRTADELLGTLMDLV